MGFPKGMVRVCGGAAPPPLHQGSTPRLHGPSRFSGVRQRGRLVSLGACAILIRVVPRVVCRILGSLESTVDGASVEVASPRERAVLGLLLLHAGEVVSIDGLIDWCLGTDAADERPSPRPRVRLQAAFRAGRRRVDLDACSRLRHRVRRVRARRRRFHRARRRRPGRRVKLDWTPSRCAASTRRSASGAAACCATSPWKAMPAPPRPGSTIERRTVQSERVEFGARARPPSRADPRPGASRRSRTTRRAAARAAHACPLPHRPTGGRARALPRGPPDARATSSASSPRARAARASSRRFCGTTRRWHLRLRRMRVRKARGAPKIRSGRRGGGGQGSSPRPRSCSSAGPRQSWRSQRVRGRTGRADPWRRGRDHRRRVRAPRRLGARHLSARRRSPTAPDRSGSRLRTRARHTDLARIAADVPRSRSTVRRRASPWPATPSGPSDPGRAISS